MFFYCYSLQIFEPDTLYLYGRKLETENLKDLEEIEKCKRKLMKITVDPVKSPILAICIGKIENLKKDLERYFGTMEFMEEDFLKNIFYADLENEIHVVRFQPKNMQKIEDFKSDFCAKIFFEFASPLEAALISKKIKTPCVLKIKTNKTFIKMEDIESVYKTNMPRMNFAAFDVKLHKNEVVAYSICINGSKYYAGLLKGQEIPDTKKKCGIEIFTTHAGLYARIEKILLSEEIDCAIYFNSAGQMMKLFNRLIICDMYQYATANLKCREYSVEEVCNYFAIEVEDYGNGICVSKALYDAFIASDALILAKELSELSGYTVNKILTNNKAEIIEYALFHELYDKKYVLPPKKTNEAVKYEGGLVLDPVVKCHENLILLLDFNSLYPSIIQEYNVCFSNPNFDSDEKGFLPKILADLVQRRKAVKKLMSEDKDNRLYDIRQKALKIIANSIYGSLGFTNSRICNFKMASFITNKGREILMDTKKSIEETLRLKVIYGDTDSLMIDTELSYEPENIPKAKEIAKKVVEMVNSKYGHIEIELEKIFIRLFLYAKKKYVGKYLDMKNQIVEEYKGIDVVKRNFCPASIDILNKVLKILLDTEKHDLYKLLETEFANLAFRDKKEFIINNVLSKPPNQYPANCPQPFVHLCNRLKTKGIEYKTGDTVSYIIGKSEKDEPFYKRAFLLTEEFALDMEYYISHQIMPPLKRILAVSNNINLERICNIFNVKGGKVKNLPVATSSQITTDCCKNIQSVSQACDKCNNVIPERWYLKEIKKMIGLKYESLYSKPFECKDCKVAFEGFFYNCLYCSQELEFNSPNEEFDNFLDDLQEKFKDLNYKGVKEVILMHLECSEYRFYDLSPYFEIKLKNIESESE